MMKENAAKSLALFSVGVGASLGVLALSVRELADFDLPGHLAVGRLVVQHRGPIFTDELSQGEHPIAYVEYASDVGLYLIDRLGGPLALQVVGALLALTIAALLVRGGKEGGRLSYVVTGLALAAMQPWLLARPATASFVLLAALGVIIEEHRRVGGAAGRRLYWLVPMFVLWANTHGFVVVGLAILVGYAIYAALCRLSRGALRGLLPEEDGIHAGQVAVAAGLSVGATTCNQAGALLLTGPLRAIRDPGHAAEWATTTLAFLTFEAPLVLLFACATLAALSLGRDPASRRRGVTLFDVGLVVLALALGRSAVRMLPLAMILVAPLTARRLGAVLPRRRAVDVACGFATWLVGPWMLASSPAARGVGFDPAHFSEKSIEYIETACPAGAMYNTLALGGWLDLRLFPRFQTFVDHRQAWVHDRALLATYYVSEHDPAAFAELDARFDFQWAVVFAAEGSHFAVPIVRSPAWTLVFWDDAAAVYVKNQGPNAAVARDGYQLFRHLTLPEEVWNAAIARDARAKSLDHDGRLAESQAPESARAAFLAGCGAIAVGDRGALDADIAALSRIAPAHPAIEALRQGWAAAAARPSG